MANITVDTSGAVSITYEGANILVVQNLGPGVVYIDNTSEVTADTGFKLISGSGYEFPRPLNEGAGQIWLISDTDATDVRYLEV